MGNLSNDRPQTPIEPALMMGKSELPDDVRTTNLVRAWRHPLELVRRMLEWEPLETIAPMRMLRDEIFVPAFTVKEVRDAFVFRADLPGVDPKKVEVRIDANRLIITGERAVDAREEGETFYAYERTFGAFSRSFVLPGGILPEKIRAELKDGVLTVIVPRVPEMQPRHIDVKVS